MNIYLLSRTDEVDYDEYDAFVVAAPDQESALSLRRPKPDDYHHDWTKDEYVSVELIGTTDKYTEPTEILGSFNAG